MSELGDRPAYRRCDAYIGIFQEKICAVKVPDKVGDHQCRFMPTVHHWGVPFD